MEYRLLGPLEILDDGRPLDLPAGKPRALLVVLLLRAGDVVPTDVLVEALWQAEPPTTAANALQGYVKHLRRVLGRDAVVTRPPGYVLALAAGDLVDLSVAERLASEGREALAGGRLAQASERFRAALDLFRGAPLAEFRYEAWAQPPIARLEELRFGLLEERIEADLALGRHRELVGEIEALVSEQPLRERARGHLMLALYRAGRQAEALEVYQQARRTLVEELGIDPAPALQDLEKRILNHDPSLDLPSVPSARSVEEAAARSPERAILVAPYDEMQLPELLPLAELFAQSQVAHELLLTRLVQVEPAETASARLGQALEQLEEVRTSLTVRGLHARVAAFTSGENAEDLVRLADRPEVDFLLLGAEQAILADGRFSTETQAVLADAPSHVGLWVRRMAAPPVVEAKPIVVPFGAAEHDWAALEVAAWLASASGAELHLLGSTADSASGRRDASRLLADAALLIQRASGVVPKPVLVEPGRDGVLEASTGASLLVLGLSERWAEEGLGPLRWGIARSAQLPLLFLRRGLRPSGLAPPASATRFTWSITQLGAPRTPSPGGSPSHE